MQVLNHELLIYSEIHYVKIYLETYIGLIVYVIWIHLNICLKQSPPFPLKRKKDSEFSF